MIFSLKGELLAMKRETFKPWISDKTGWAEYEASMYWDAITKTCGQLRNEEPELLDSVAGIGVTALRDSIVNVDHEGNPLRKVIIWSDQRKAKTFYKPGILLKIILGFIGMNDTLRKAQKEGKSNWIRQNQPEIWKKTFKLLQVSGYLNFRFTGLFNDSLASQIGHLPFDYKKLKWGNPRELMTFSAKIYPVEKEKLPELVNPGQILGYITEKASSETGLPVGLPVVACGSDKGCETLGNGVVGDEWASLSFGTTATIQTTSNKYLEPIKFMPSYPSVIEGKFNPEVEIFRGFWMITWFKNEFAHNEVEKALKHNIPAEEVMNALLHMAPPGSNGLMVQPFWGPGLSEPAAKGAMIGYGDIHKKPHVYRAVIEGLIYGLREGKDRIEKVSGKKITKLVVSGGGSQSNEICQIAADIFNMPILRGRTSESSGLGAAMITATGLKFYDSIETAVNQMVAYQHEFRPDSKHVEIYDKLYRQIYLKMYKALEPFYHKIRDITGYPER